MNEIRLPASWHLRRAAWIALNFREGVFGTNQNWRENPQWATKRAIYRIMFICWHLRNTIRWWGAKMDDEVICFTKTGKPVTQHDIETWAAEAERGYPVIYLLPDGKIICDGCTVYPLAGGGYVTAAIEDMCRHIENHNRMGLPALTGPQWAHAYHQRHRELSAQLAELLGLLLLSAGIDATPIGPAGFGTMPLAEVIHEAQKFELLWDEGPAE